MITDFLLVLMVIVAFTGIVTLVDMIFSMVKHEPLFGKRQRPVLIEYCRSFFPVLLAVLLIRSFVVQPFRVPSGSLEPTIVPGDFIIVNQFDYGLTIPVWNKKILKIGEPKKGQIALFYYPVDHKMTFIKRVIGVPGDHISYINKVLYINGKKQPQKYLGMATDSDGNGTTWKVKVYQEILNGVKHRIYIRPDKPGINFYNLVVPKGEYFMMGDNRDNSDDSRYWGFVPQNTFIGRASRVWLSWNSKGNGLHKIRWDRFWTKL